VCGKEFVGKTSQVLCSDACRKTKALEYKRNWAAKHGTPARQAKREALGLTKATRLQMLRQAAVRVGIGISEPDPVAKMAKVAARERMACGEG
jgi:hypothetical protein